jgi:hypothetical protein
LNSNNKIENRKYKIKIEMRKRGKPTCAAVEQSSNSP